MTRVDTLKSLEGLLESFLDRAVSLKEDRLRVLDGINRLDDIARGFRGGGDLTEEIGGWFAQHSDWLASPTLRPADQNRIGDLLSSIRAELDAAPETSPARVKISQEISRWQTVSKPETLVSGPVPASPQTEAPSPPKLTLRRGAEPASPTPDSRVPAPDDSDTITLFANVLSRLQTLLLESSAGRSHILSVLDDLLRSATARRDREALLLSAFVIYWLKQHRYRVDPYVKRLKEAEALLAGGEHA